MEPRIDLLSHMELVEEVPRWPFGNLKGIPLSSSAITDQKLEWLAHLIAGKPDRAKLAWEIRNEQVRRQITKDKTPEPKPATMAEHIAKLQAEAGIIPDYNVRGIKAVHESGKYVASGKRKAIVPELGERGMPQPRKEGHHWRRQR
jgi:hypothetical protein